MNRQAITRGHPLVALLAVVGGWIGGRSATWEEPVESAVVQPAPVAAPLEDAAYVVDTGPGPQSYAGSMPAYGGYPEYGPTPGYAPRGYAPTMYYPYPAAPTYAMAPRTASGPIAGLQPYPRVARSMGDEFSPANPLPPFYAPEPPGMAGRAMGSGAPTAALRPKRWSVDAWAFLRRDEDGGAVSPGLLPSTYGGSQTGAVLRYRLSTTNPYQPSVYLRTTATTGRFQETSAALGLSARPLPSLPVIAAVEGRLTQFGGQKRIQPVVMAVTQLPPFVLPMDLRGEAYGQAGYVAGKFATPFADGQLRADRSLFSFGQVDARLGGGIWGGIQKGAARLDTGPSAMITLPLGRGLFGRAAFDWRFRVAGDAVPGSGPALTLSAGF